MAAHFIHISGQKPSTKSSKQNRIYSIYSPLAAIHRLRESNLYFFFLDFFLINSQEMLANNQEKLKFNYNYKLLTTTLLLLLVFSSLGCLFHTAPTQYIRTESTSLKATNFSHFFHFFDAAAASSILFFASTERRHVMFHVNLGSFLAFQFQWQQGVLLMGKKNPVGPSSCCHEEGHTHIFFAFASFFF